MMASRDCWAYWLYGVRCDTYKFDISWSLGCEAFFCHYCAYIRFRFRSFYVRASFSCNSFICFSYSPNLSENDLWLDSISCASPFISLSFLDSTCYSSCSLACTYFFNDFISYSRDFNNDNLCVSSVSHSISLIFN
jgi:hypothetical protein